MRQAELLNQLNTNRISELGITTTGLNTIAQGRSADRNAERQRLFEAAQQNANRAGTAYLDAVNRAWAEYQAGRLPPAMLEAILNYAATFSPPGVAVS